MKLATSTYVKIGLILLLCLTLCGWLAGCGRYGFWGNRGISFLPTGGVLGCMGMEIAEDAVDSLIDAGVPEAPTAPKAPSAPAAPTSPGELDAWGSGSFEVDAELVSAIEISWLAGEINLCVVPDEETGGAIQVVETAQGRAPDMGWDLSNGVLSIDYADSPVGLSGCAIGWSGRKELTINVPKSLQGHLKRFYLSAASGEYSLMGDGNRFCSNMALDVASGHVVVEGSDVDDLEVSIASGTIGFYGTVAQKLSIDQASGEFFLSDCSSAPKTIAGSLASGHIVLELPASTSLMANVDKISGSFENDFAASRGNVEFSCDLDFDMASGSLEVVAVQ